MAKKKENGNKKDERDSSGCAQDAAKISRSCGSSHDYGYKSGRAQDKILIAQDGGGSIEEVEDGVVRIKVDGV